MHTLKTISIAALAASAASASVTVSDVAFTQDDATHDVTVTYNLTTGDGEPAFVSLDILTNGVSVGATHVKNVSGDVSTSPADVTSLVTPGNGKSIAWKARADLPGVGLANAAVRVTAIATNHFEGLYLVIDLSPSIRRSSGSAASPPGRSRWGTATVATPRPSTTSPSRAISTAASCP